MINTVCFDLDSTLVDSEHVILESFKYAFDKFKPESKLSLTDCRVFMGPTLQETFSKYCDTQAEIDEMIACYLEHYKAIEMSIIKLFPTVKETLKYLYEHDFNICLVTNKYLSSAVPSINSLGIIDYFNDFVCLDRQEYPKPHAFPILLAMKDYGVKRENTIMVGDNAVDITCAKNAGVKFVGVNWVSWVNEVKELQPDYMLNQMSELVDIINELNKE